MIDGLSHLLTMRRAGLRPRSVMLSIDCPYLKPKYPSDFEAMELTIHDSVACDDFRAFKGLDVVFYVPEWSELAAEALEKLKQYAKEITVLCADYGSDIGYFWRPETGVIDLDDYRWVQQYHDARKTLCVTKQDNQTRIQREREATNNVKDLPTRYGKFDL